MRVIRRFDIPGVGEPLNSDAVVAPCAGDSNPPVHASPSKTPLAGSFAAGNQGTSIA
jgi:hypothetical protein